MYDAYLSDNDPLVVEMLESGGHVVTHIQSLYDIIQPINPIRGFGTIEHIDPLSGVVIEGNWDYDPYNKFASYSFTITDGDIVIDVYGEKKAEVMRDLKAAVAQTAMDMDNVWAPGSDYMFTKEEEASFFAQA